MTTRMTGRVGRVLLALMPSVAAAAPAQQAEMESAAALVKAGQYRAAERAYTAVLSRAALDSGTQAAALFGRSFAAQQVTSADSAPGRAADAILADYLKVRRLDSAHLYAAASNNAGVVLRGVGRHREAARLFLDAARTDKRARAYYLYNAAGEYKALGRPDSSAALYRRAIAAEPGYTEARVALLDYYTSRPRPDSLLALATRWTDPGALEPVNNAILTRLSRPGTADSAKAGRLLLVLARNLSYQEPGPGHFTRAYASRTLLVGRAYPSLEPPVSALVHAYRERGAGKEEGAGPGAGDDQRYVETEGGRWWRSTRGSDERPTTWSRTLRALGDHHFKAGREATAASYYEAALDYPNLSMPQRWMDLGALLPLGVIYGHQAEYGPEPRKSVAGLNDYIEWLFRGKGASYQANDLRQVRSYHMALGEIFAEQERWGDRRDPRSVIFQLERMRTVTDILKQHTPEENVFDPPDLLERLATAYQKTGQPGEARAVAQAAREGYLALGRQADAGRMQQLMEQTDGY